MRKSAIHVGRKISTKPAKPPVVSRRSGDAPVNNAMSVGPITKKRIGKAAMVAVIFQVVLFGAARPICPSCRLNNVVPCPFDILQAAFLQPLPAKPPPFAMARSQLI